jgi:ligand-binding sensor domain-containing protein/DNA-binding CsgD family transcriptional regulator
MIRTQLSFWVCLLICLNHLSAQFNTPQFDYINLAEGLPHNTVYCLIQDKNRFIWLGTQDGLVRFDGYNCRVFRQNETDTLGFQGKSIHCLLEDKQGNVWVGTQTDGLNIRYNQSGQFKNLTYNPPFKILSKTWVKTIFEDKDGRIWIGTMGKGVLVFDPKTQTAKLYNSSNSTLKDNAVSKVVQDENGTIWVGTNGKGIYYLEENKQDFQQLHTTKAGDTDFDSFRKTFFADKKGTIWVGTEGSGLYKIDIKTKQIQSFTLQSGLSSNNIMGIAEDGTGQLLLATDGGGLNVFNPKTQAITVFSYRKSPNTLNTNALFDVLIDHDKNIWIGTYNGGVNVFKAHKTRFETYTHTGNKAGELSHRSVLSLSKMADGRMLVGTDGGGLNVLDTQKKGFSIISNKPMGYGNVVKTIFEDSQKRIWLGYFNDGLSLFDTKNGSFKHFRTRPNDPLSMGGNNVWSIAEGDSSNLWLGILGGGLNFFNTKTQTFKQYRHKPNDPLSISSDDVVTVFVDKDKKVWAGTNTTGLNVWNAHTGHFTHFKKENSNPKSLSANDVRCLFQDTKGRLWVGTESAGLNLWLGEGAQFEHFTTQNGLISNAVMSILEDKKGYLWISTFKGISRFDVEKKAFLNFDFQRNPSFNANQFNQSAMVLDTEGVLYFGGINGLTLVRPDNIGFFDQKPSVVLTDFKIFNQSVPVGKLPDGRTILPKNLEDAPDIYLSYYENAFSFEFAALDFTEPLKNQYAYKMEGFDDNWRNTTGEQRLVTYTNLDPATYTFRVKGTNNNGVWSDEKTIKVRIAPPFWKTWWFKLLLVMAFTALAGLALRIYTKRREMDLKQKVLLSESAILSLTNEKLASEQAFLQLQNEKLVDEIQAKNSELMTKAVQTAHKNEILIAINEQLEDIRNANETDKNKLLRGLKMTLKTEIESEKSWEQFTRYFDQVNQNFTLELLKKHPTLTQNDLRMCALTRLNMSNKEMAALLNISVLGVEKSRYRLKKRLNLSIEDDLDNYLRDF